MGFTILPIEWKPISLLPVYDCSQFKLVGTCDQDISPMKVHMRETNLTVIRQLLAIEFYGDRVMSDIDHRQGKVNQ